MNGHTVVRMRTLFGNNEGNEELGERHVAIEDIPAEITWQSHHCHLDGDIKVVKLTLEPEVEQPAEDPDDPAFFPLYGVIDQSLLYD
jgi:hypothetical protein